MLLCLACFRQCERICLYFLDTIKFSVKGILLKRLLQGFLPFIDKTAGKRQDIWKETVCNGTHQTFAGAGSHSDHALRTLASAYGHLLYQINQTSAHWLQLLSLFFHLKDGCVYVAERLIY